MATTRLMTTVLPYSVDPADPFHVSLFFTHRLDGETLDDHRPVMTDWPEALREATITLRTDNSPSLACTPLLQDGGNARLVPPRTSTWQTAFPANTAVRAYPEPKLTKSDWNTYPANKTPDHALEAYYASVCSSPVGRPGVLGNPLAEELLDRLAEIDGLRDLIGDLRGYATLRDTHRRDLITSRNAAAREAVKPTKPEPGAFDVPIIAGPRLYIEQQPWRSPIEMLLGQDNVDSLITEFLDRLLANPQGANNAMLAMLRDVHAAQCYYNRPEEQQPSPRPDQPIAGSPPAPRTPHESPDFHERAAGACNVPTLARALGLVVDVRVDDLTALRAATRISCDVVVDGTEKYVSPETLCAATGSRLLPVAETERWNAGRLRLGDPLRYRVMDLDSDAVALALEQLLRSGIRALATEANGDPASFAPAGLRATGFSIAELARPDALRDRLTKAENLKAAVDTGGSAQQPNQFHYEDLLRGTRVEVWDDATDEWHSLHRRRVSASFDTATILTDAPDTGYLQNPPPSRVPGDDTNPYYVHEVLAGWEGWSLSAPRPGRLIIHDDGRYGDAGSEHLTDQPETQDGGLRVQSTAEPGSLPALRYGRSYSFRIVGVDLAGNSVPLNPKPAAKPTKSAVDITKTHLQGLRTEVVERDKTGLLAGLRKKGLTNPEKLTGDDERAEINRATASVVKNASSLRMHPQFDADPGLVAALSTDSGDPNTISTPRSFLRWNPVPSPTLVPRKEYTTGESLQRMVIRTGLTGQAGRCERHIAPPKTSQWEAELDGRFDQLMRAGKRKRAFAIALKERGNLLHTSIQSLDSPTKTIPQPGVELLASRNAADRKTLGEIQNSEMQPAEGQYVIHDVDQLVLPYLPDPMADGVALVFYEAGADHRFNNPRLLQSVVIRYTGAWPEIQPFRLVIHEAPQLDARQDGNVIDIGLPAGEQVAVALSTTLDAEHLDKMGAWRFHPAHDQKVPEADRLTLQRAALNGWLWWLTPDEDLRLVHATARPAVRPEIVRLTAKPRNPNVVTADLDGVIDVHGPSTDKVELRARWEDITDTPGTDGPIRHTTNDIVAEYRIDQHEGLSLLTLQQDAEVVGNRVAEVPIRTALHNLPDTKARTVFYRMYGSSRYREFFPPEQLPGPADEKSAGAEVAVTIPSSAVSAPPVVRDVIPMFKWEQTTEPGHPVAIRRIRRSGVRIWLDRPWYSSGDGELLAVITTGNPALADGDPETVSLWARDPILFGPKLVSAKPRLANAKPQSLTSTEVPLLSAWEQRAAQLALDPLTEPGRPVLRVERKPDYPKDKGDVAYAFTPEFHPDRKRWFVDVILDSASAVWPFLRLAVARYQPDSISDKAFSKVITTDFVQLPPERIATISRPDAGDVRVTLTGVTAVTNTPGADKPDQPADHDGLMAALTRSRRVLATLQSRNGLSGSDIDWVEVATSQCTLDGVDPDTFKATWTAALPLDPEQRLATPGRDSGLRVQLEEYELLSADPEQGEQTPSTTQRLVYADHLYL